MKREMISYCQCLIARFTSDSIRISLEKRKRCNEFLMNGETRMANPGFRADFKSSRGSVPSWLNPGSPQIRRCLLVDPNIQKLNYCRRAAAASAFHAAPKKTMIAEICIQTSKAITAARPPYTTL